MENYYGMLKRLMLLVAAIAITSFSYAQQRDIIGHVTDAGDGNPIPGVNVVIKGTTNGTITDFEGNFTLKAADTDVLVFTYVGYLAQEQTVGSNSALNVSLQPSDVGLDEVVVIGYGTVKKGDATGSVTAVSAKDFNKGAITSAQDLLVGKSAGVVITSAGGAPGSGSTIRIRGGSSLNASNNPLIIVDGVPIENSDNNVSGSANALSFINPNDIETFTVLKDASATAIYGSRASNGVIIITTKKGDAKKPMVISYNGNVSIATPIKYVDVYSGDELRQIAFEKSNIFDAIAFDKLGTQNTDWQKEIFQTAVSHDHNLSVSGAYKTLPYRVSVGYTDQTGILKNTDMKRVTGTINLNPSLLNNTLKVDLNAKIMNSRHNFGDNGAIGSAISMDPTQPIYENNENSGGYFQWVNHGANLGTPNPVEQALEIDNKSDVTRFIGNLQLNYKIPFFPELQANLNVATDYTTSSGYNNKPTTSPSVLISPLGWGKLTDFNAENKNNLIDFYLNYSKILDQIKSKIDVTAGYSWQHFERKKDNYTRAIQDVDHDYQVSDSSSSITESYLVSFFGRMNYTFMDKYLLTATVRYDGSSRFAKDNRWGLFPSAAFAWKVKEESFLKNIDIISDLKLRLGWGITGQQDIGNDYPAQASYTTSYQGYYYQLGNIFVPTLRADTYDSQIKWEETVTQNIGIDFGFINNRLTGSIDVYKRETRDLLNKVTIAGGSNLSNKLLTNVGSLENKGIEVSLNYIPISKPDLMSLNLGINFTYNINEVTKLLLTDDPTYIGVLYGSGMTGTTQITTVGSAARSFFVNQQVYDNNGAPIEGLYVDRSGKGGVVNGVDANKYIYKNPTPDYIIGFSARFNYKQFDISTSLRANIGNYVLNQVASGASYDQMQQIGYWKNMPTYLSESNFVKRQFTSDYFVENASFLKMDNISVGYSFENVVDKLNAHISFTVQNAFTITKYKGIDPEVDLGGDNPGIDNNFYPRPRTFMLGISLTY